jgi:hypothetical protein
MKIDGKSLIRLVLYKQKAVLKNTPVISLSAYGMARVFEYQGVIEMILLKMEQSKDFMLDVDSLYGQMDERLAGINAEKDNPTNQGMYEAWAGVAAELLAYKERGKLPIGF